MNEGYTPTADFLVMVANDEIPLTGGNLADHNLMTLIAYTRDDDVSNRDWATMLLAQQQIDTPEVRKALLTAAKDENNVVRAEALLGLARRDPSIALPLVRQELTGNVACMALFEAATELASPMLVDVLRLWSEPSDNPFLDGWASEALAACVNAGGQR
jgi:hypothetical protein